MTNGTLPALISIPPPIEERLKNWKRLWTVFARLHYILGGLSVLLAALSATGLWQPQLFAALAAVFTALIGFVQPDRKYRKFVRAWRELDGEAVKYSLGQSDLTALALAMARGERLISEYEAQDFSPPAQEKITPLPAGGLRTPA